MMIATFAGIIALWISKAPKRTLEKQIIAMHGLPINLRFEKSKAYYYGVDSTFVISQKKNLIVYVDSTSCTKCFFDHILDYYEVNDSLVKFGGSLVVVINSGHEMKNNVLSRIKYEKFPFWCIIDEDCEFICKNKHIPDNKILQTFMIDSNCRIALVGDPTRNKLIMNLLINILHDDLTL